MSTDSGILLPDVLSTTLTLRQRDPRKLGGFKVGWIDGEGEGFKFELLCGAGVGSSLLELEITPEGGRPVWYEVSMAGVLRALLDQLPRPTP
jgi:hypothetical protein